MEPDVRYCTTTDGVRIAYTVTGEGPPVVWLLDPTGSHVRLEWSHAVIGRSLAEMARHNTVIRLDWRGTGLSERLLPRSFEEMLLDIEAVVGRVGPGRFAVIGYLSSSPAAIAFAARHAEQVRRLVIADGFARFADVYSAPQIVALFAAAGSDWEMATEAIGGLAFGPGREESRVNGAFVRSCVGPEYLQNAAAFASVDVTDLASTLPMPVLIVRHSGVRWITDEMTQELVSLIPDARLAMVDGTLPDDIESVTQRIAAFINDDADQPAGGRTHAPSGVRTVLFTDLVGHTEMMRRLGDARGRALLREHERITREAIAKHGGSEIKTDGDSFMVSFGSVAAAMECAVALQRAFAQRNETSSEPLRVRIGLNAGEPIEEDGPDGRVDLFGEAVILAARIAAQADAGEILIAEPVRHLLAGKGFVFADRGEFVPKGFEDAVRLFEVRWRE